MEAVKKIQQEKITAFEESNRPASASKNENQSNSETKVYSLRYWIGLLYALQIMLLRLNMNSYGLVNNVYKAYFGISYYAIDWFILIQIPGMFAAAVVLIFLILNEMMGFRKLFITMATCTLISYAFSELTFSYPRLFPLIYVGQFVAGFGFQTSIAIFSTFATSWFPENQAGIALSLKPMSMCIACLLAFLIPSQLVQPPPFSLTEVRNNTILEASNSSLINTTITNWFHETRSKFLYLNGSLFIGCIVVCFFVTLLVTDEPPKPPSIAQALLRAQRYKIQISPKLVGFDKFWAECKLILTNKTIILSTVVLMSLFICNYMEDLLMGEISRKVFVFLQYRFEINKMSGYILIFFEIGGLLGVTVTAKLLDNFSCHKILLVTGMVFSLVSMIGLSIGQHFFNVIALYIFNTSLGFALCLCYAPLFDMVLQDSYPQNSSLVMLVYISITNCFSILFGQLSRLILDFTSGTVLLLCISCLLLIGSCVSLFLNPKYKRQKASDLESKSEEDLALLNNEE